MAIEAGRAERMLKDELAVCIPFSRVDDLSASNDLYLNGNV
jgi:hypothetical protein